MGPTSAHPKRGAAGTAWSAVNGGEKKVHNRRTTVVGAPYLAPGGNLARRDRPIASRHFGDGTSGQPPKASLGRAAGIRWGLPAAAETLQGAKA